MNTNTNYIVIYRMDFAIQLIQKGYKVISTMPNPCKTRYTSWIFERSEALEQDLNSLKGGMKLA